MARIRKQIGERRNSVIIQTITTVDGDDGEPDTTYPTLATVKASIEEVAGEEYMEAGQQRSSATHRIEFPWSSDYSAIGPKTHRLLFGSRIFQLVRAPNVSEENHTIACEVMEKK